MKQNHFLVFFFFAEGSSVGGEEGALEATIGATSLAALVAADIALAFRFDPGVCG
jgi:hypothetical protein